MSTFDDTRISRAIVQAYHEKLSRCLVSDVLIAGAGPSGMVAGAFLARRGLRVTIVEKRLSPGGGIWGGGMGMSDVVIQDDALPILDEAGIRHERKKEDLHIVDAVELAAGLAFDALKAGANLLNLLTVEDVGLREGRVTGLVVNRTMISGVLPVDPLTFEARATIDGTGHEAIVVEALRRRDLLGDVRTGPFPVEGPMDAPSGEAFVVEKAGEVYPGVWVSGMSVCATYGGPRMGPIFGGMLLSGRRVAGLIAKAL